MATSGKLGFQLLDEGQAGGEVVFNDATRALEVFSGAFAIEKQGDTAPPGGESEGQAWIVGSSATGAWSGQDDKIAVYLDAAWTFFSPKEGMRIWIKFNDKYKVYTGSQWVGGDAVNDLNQTISGPSVTEVQAISDKVDALLAELRKLGFVTGS